ncbi:formamidopyrimidine-DNA glycosylase [Kytococcus aerolatus]|uniref:Formamidopyrimidine-DNA glycosylase n=1 Tax=Kytococcus aerolatus TaxID=592308 RepID=A0A212TGE7_9MICO|nr:DNA-formamidopyrimidine glycosylase family protein [Kytococcus aerolatus]SNC64896.1 formamidopyrimidine-DNA glycosylase [Kytococcus aerolatus]
MPELPEVEGLAAALRERLVGRAVAETALASFSLLKTVGVPPQALHGRPVDDVRRYGKYLSLVVDGTHVVVHLMRAGWVAWHDEAPRTRLRPGGRSPVALRMTFDDGSGLDLTEAGTRKGMAAWIVDDPAQVEGLTGLGPDALGLVPPLEMPPLVGVDRATGEVRVAVSTTAEERAGFWAGVLAGRRTRLKGLLREQAVVSGIGNGWSDEICHTARLSPFALGDSLDAGQTGRLAEAVHEVLLGATERAVGRAPEELKDGKREGMRVHGRAGQECPVCGDVVREVVYADSSMQYCPGCQTGGQVLADRSTSRFVK